MTKEKATARIKVFPSLHKKLKVRAAKDGTSISYAIKSLIENEQKNPKVSEKE